MMMFDEESKKFKNRVAAGRALASEIKKRKIKADLIIALPRGGVPVGKILSEEMQLPLKLCYVKKIGHPVNKEYAIGAVTEDDELIINNEHIDEQYINKMISKARSRIMEMKLKFGHNYDSHELVKKTIILVDDGIATGICLKLAAIVMRKHNAQKIIIATPVCAANTVSIMQKTSDLFICLLSPLYFVGIGAYYNEFNQLTDEEVSTILSS